MADARRREARRARAGAMIRRAAIFVAYILIGGGIGLVIAHMVLAAAAGVTAALDGAGGTPPW